MWWVGVLVFVIALLIGAVIYANRQRSAGLAVAAAQLGLKAYLGPNRSPRSAKALIFFRGVTVEHGEACLPRTRTSLPLFYSILRIDSD